MLQKLGIFASGGAGAAGGYILTKAHSVNKAYVDLDNQLKEITQALETANKDYEALLEDGLSDKQLEHVNQAFKHTVQNHLQRLYEIEGKINKDVVLKHSLRTINQISNSRFGGNFCTDIEKKVHELAVGATGLKITTGKESINAFTPEDLNELQASGKNKYLKDNVIETLGLDGLSDFADSSIQSIAEVKESAALVISQCIVLGAVATIDAMESLGRSEEEFNEDMESLGKELSEKVENNVVGILNYLGESEEEFNEDMESLGKELSEKVENNVVGVLTYLGEAEEEFNKDMEDLGDEMGTFLLNAGVQVLDHFTEANQRQKEEETPGERISRLAN